MAKASKQQSLGVLDVEVFCLNITMGEVCYESDLMGSLCRKDFTEELYPTISTFWNVRTGLLTR